MAEFTVNPTRFDPYKNFKFRVKWDGPKPGDCCVFCSFGSVPCLPMQMGDGVDCRPRGT